MASIFPLFVPAIKDYIDIINNLYDSTVGNINLLQLLQQSLIYLVVSIKFLIFYFLSFQWIQDLSYLPVVIPQIKLEILKEHFFLQTPQSNFLTFLEIPSYTNNKFFLGFVNSFFLCLPLSVGHIISLRRLLIQGLPAGIFSSLGTICGQILLLICILFGGRFFITPWFNFQVVNYFFGLWLVLKTVYEMCHERSIRIIEKSNLATLAKIFLLNFILTWTEQSCVFQYFGNLTVGAEPSIIEIFSSLSVLQSILTHVTYISGIIVGTCFFTSFFLWFTLKLNNIFIQFLSILYSRWIRRLNFSLIVLIIGFTFTSIPFYSFDYLVLSNFGFVAQDKSFQNTIFSPTKIYDITPAILGDGNLLNNYVDQKPGIDTDITPFNKGRYLMFDVNDSFEQLNYQGEYAWLTKKNRTPTISRDPSSSAVLSKVSKFFKKNKKLTTVRLNSSNQKSKKNVKNKSDTKSNTAQNFDNNSETNLNFDNFENSNIFSTQTKDDNFEQNLHQIEKSINVLDSRNQTDRVINESFEKLINTSVSSKFFINNPMNKSTLEKKFQQRYYSNPIYKLLLSTDIDLFLLRQPKSLFLSPKQEHELFKNRLILANYYDSLRYYNQLPYQEEFKDIFNGSKSYADRVYNHQFNGTLKIVRRLFSINENLNDHSIENSEQNFMKKLKKQTGQLSEATESETFFKKTVNNKKSFVLKFDQPLYKKINIKTDENKIFFHEEFNLNRKFNNDKHTKLPIQNKIKQNNFESTQLQPDNFMPGHLVPEREIKSTFSPFIELTNPSPFYVGWDEQLRKLVITNRLSPNKLTGESMKFFNKNFATEYFSLNKLIKKNKIITFTTWPKSSLKKNKFFVSEKVSSQANLQKVKRQDNFSYNFLVDSLQDQQNMNTYNNLIENDLDLKIILNEKNIPINAYGELLLIPTNILSKGGNQIENQMQDIMPYTRGGFVWPGHYNLKLHFKNLISNNS